ncbi:hypothetical protein EV182_003456, partial [Spiromyces aspiralis]
MRRKLGLLDGKHASSSVDLSRLNDSVTTTPSTSSEALSRSQLSAPSTPHVRRSRSMEFEINGTHCVFRPHIPTPIMEILCGRPENIRTFVDNLVFLLNRE